MSNDKELISGLRAIVGKENISDKIFERAAYGQDAISPDIDVNKIPIAIVRPGSVEEVSKIVEFANKHKLPLHIHGAGTAFKGSAHPKRPSSVILSTARLDSFEMMEEDLYCEVGAGVRQIDLELKLAEQGYMLPMNVGSKYSATIGGAVSVNTIGHMVDICLGKIIDYVMGVQAVLPTGEIIETGTRSIRRPAGIDYTRFFVGMEGEFGIITKVRMRLLPAPKKAYVVGFFKTPRDVALAFMRIYQEKLPPPLYGEILQKEACVNAFRVRGIGQPKGDMGLVNTIGYTQEEADRQARDIERIFKAAGAIEARVVTSEKEQEDLWAARDNISTVQQVEEGQEKLVAAGGIEFCMPLSHLADAIDYVKTGHSFSALHEAQNFIYGHVGTCDLHMMWVAPASWPAEKIGQCIRESTLLEKELNLKWGCASGEVGQMALRIPFFKERYGEAAYSALLNIKKAIDPNNILNPGNLEGE